MRLVLWGDRAVEFDGEAVRAMGVKEPVIAIFVGTLPKMARGIRGLSGSSACRWYIDEDIPDINSFHASLGEQFVPLAPYVPTGPDAVLPQVQETPVAKTVRELIELDPFVDMEKRFFCTVTVSRLGSDQRWWFPSCAACRKSAKHTGYQYRCSNDDCRSVEADLTYCISVFASDGMAEAEFVLFDKVAAAAVGRPLVSLLRQRYPGYATMEEIANVARHDSAIPLQLTRLIGQKHRLMVSISKKWKVRNSEDLSFQVARIEETYKPELPPLVSGVSSECGGFSAISTASGEQLPVLGPVIPPVPATPSPQGSNTDRPFSASSGSPAGTARTPASSVAKISPSTPAARPVAPMRGARRSLFQTPSKDKPLVVVEDGSASQQVLDPAVDAVVDDGDVAIEGEAAGFPSIKNKDDDASPLENKDSELPSPKAKDAKVLPPKNNDLEPLALKDKDAEVLPSKNKRNAALAKSDKPGKKTKQ